MTEQEKAQACALAALTDAQKTELWEGTWNAFRDQYEKYREANPGWQAFWTEHHESALDAAFRFAMPFLHSVYTAEVP